MCIYSNLYFVRLKILAGTKIDHFLLEYKPCQFGIQIQHFRDCYVSGERSQMIGAEQVFETLVLN